MVSTLAGGISGTTSAYVDGDGTNAGFKRPYGVAVDASGNVFVADYDNNRIRKVTAGGGTRIGPVTPRACLLCGHGRGSASVNGSGVSVIDASLHRIPSLFFCRGSRY